MTFSKQKKAAAIGISLLMLFGGLNACRAAPQTHASSSESSVKIQPSQLPTEAFAESTAELSRQEEFEEFLEKTNEAHKAQSGSGLVPNLAAYTPDFAHELDLLSEADISALLENREMRAVTKEEAAQDVDLLFRALKSAYGPYHYFGGDQVFLPARDAALQDLEQQDTWDPGDLESLLMGYFSGFLKDAHFRIGSTNVAESLQQYMYYVPDFYFTEADGLDPAYIKPTIGPEGRITSCLAALSTDGSNLPKTMEYQGKPMNLSWEKAGGLDANMEGPAFLEEVYEGIPHLASRRMYAQEPGDEALLERFAACGSEYRQAPVLFLDVRGNTGGSDQWFLQFLHNLTYYYPGGQRANQATKYSPLFVASIKPNFSGGAVPQPGLWQQYNGRYAVWNESLSGQIDFVLMDKGSASSGEGVVSSTRNSSHFIYVGSNTHGAFTGSNNISCRLPNSGLSLYFAAGLSLVGESENIDGRGFLPDLWVNPPDTLQAVSRLCSYYELGEG